MGAPIRAQAEKKKAYIDVIVRNSSLSWWRDPMILFAIFMKKQYVTERDNMLKIFQKFLSVKHILWLYQLQSDLA